MKRSERVLLDNLKNRQPINSEEPLKNVKNSLGSIGRMVSNPLTKNELSISVDVFFADPTIPAILVPAAIPAAYQFQMPLYLFGLSDMYANYSRTLPLTQCNPIWTVPFGTGFVGYNFNAAPLNAFFMLLIQDGDYIIFYNPIPTLEAMIRIRCHNVAYSTLVHSLMSDIIFIKAIRYNVPAASILQYTQSLKIAVLSTFGKIAVDTIDPRMFILPTLPQQNIADITVNLPCDKRMILATAIEFVCQHIDFIFFVEKIEVLTKR